MSLPHVLLGLLAVESRTGYELERAVREDLDPIWRAEYSQIYPTLARLRREGFVFLRVLGPRRGPRRNLYRITAAGRRELRRWVAGQLPAPPPDRDGTLARIAFLDALEPSYRPETLLAEEQRVSKEIARLRSAPVPRGFRREARRGVVERLEATRRWIRSLYQNTSRATSLPAPKKR
jgi:DNA-binding PadR family transcriptional regulator